MADLPQDRLLPDKPPFTNTANKKKTEACLTGVGTPPPPLTPSEELALSLNKGQPVVTGIPGGSSSHTPCTTSDGENEGTQIVTMFRRNFIMRFQMSFTKGGQTHQTRLDSFVFPPATEITFHISRSSVTGCVLSPLLYSLFTHDCAPLHNSNIFIKYADDTTVVGQIHNNDESPYREEIRSLTAWCATNNLTLNASKTKELIVNFRKSNSRRHLPVNINGNEVERVSSFNFLGVHISEDLSWHQNTSALVKKAQQCLYFLRSLKKANLSPGILKSFYRCII
ncbi:hypothetical protein C0J45_16194 [Silurus meridionalis]|nr:hypothetical protein C0J45_16194 [Silurus meridionalis]